MRDFFKKQLDTATNKAQAISDFTTTHAKSATGSISAWKDRRTLEKNLLRRKELAREYEQNRLPAGHKYFVTVYDACMADIKQFCQKHDEDVELTTMQYPFLCSLKAKANPDGEDDRQPHILAKAFGAVAAGAGLCFLSGAGTGLFQGGHNLITKIFGS